MNNINETGRGRSPTPIIATEGRPVNTVLSGFRDVAHDARDIATVAAAIPLTAILYTRAMTTKEDNSGSKGRKERKPAEGTSRRFFRGAADAPDPKKDNDPELAASGMEEIRCASCGGTTKINGKSCDGCRGTGTIWRMKK